MSDMEDLKEKIARAMNTANGLDRGLSHEEMRDLERDYGAPWRDWMPETEAPLRAIEGDGYEISKKQNRQYYCWNSACSATSQEQPDCICWYDQGTGPLAHESPMIWRTKKLEEPRG